MPFPLLRSETVKKGTIVTSTEAAYKTVAALGQHGNLHLEDANAESMVRPYNSTLQRLEQIEQKLTYVFDQLQTELQVPMCKDNVDNFLEHAQESYSINEIETSVTHLYERMKVFSTNNSYFLHNKYTLLEELGILSLPSSYFHNSHIQNDQLFSVICGTIPSEVSQRFMRAIMMLAHANVLVLGEQIRETFKLHDKDYVEEKKGSKNKKLDEYKTYDFAFFIYFHGSNMGYLYQSLMRLVNVFGAHIYNTISDPQKRIERAEELIGLLSENTKATDAYHQFIVNEIQELTAIARPEGNSLLEEWRLYVEREKMIYTTLNKFQASDATLRISCWLLANDEEHIRTTLANVNQNTFSDAFLIVDKHFPEKSNPPTYLRSNDFFSPFQLAVDTYGVPRYKEINPGLFTVIPFPFLFAVMFGDLGHGFILFAVSVLVFASGGKGAMSGVYAARFFLLFLGLFSMFTGSLYNEFFGVGVNLFGGRYTLDTNTSTSHEAYYTPMEGASFPYPWGLDPLWRGANNELIFLNSFKMKFSIIAGFVQMIAGIILKGANCVYFKHKIEFVLVFIPQMIFFCGFVGYLVFLILFKWLTPFTYNKPSLINTFIGVFLMTPITDQDILFSIQPTLQMIIVFAILICVPILILGKPIGETIYNKMTHTHQHTPTKKINPEQTNSNTSTHPINTEYTSYQHQSTNYSSPPSTSTSSPSSSPPMTSMQLNNNETTQPDHSQHTPTQPIHIKKTQPTSSHDDDEESHTFGSLLTHQFMESTEFLLGALSNTASYLRLWALSLAHAELTKIILDQLFMMFLTMSDDLATKCVLLFFGSIVFVWCTTVVIMMMDLIEAILHGVRLQWVEFQNKFYAADGIPFTGFSFKAGFNPSTSI